VGWSYGEWGAGGGVVGGGGGGCGVGGGGGWGGWGGGWRGGGGGGGVGWGGGWGVGVGFVGGLYNDWYERFVFAQFISFQSETPLFPSPSNFFPSGPSPVAPVTQVLRT